MTEEPAPRAPHAPQATQTPAPARGEGAGPDKPPRGDTALRERLAEALRNAAYVCPGDECTLTEDECGENQPIVLAAATVIDGIPEATLIDGEVYAIADAVLPVIEEALAEQKRALAAQIALYKSAENDVTDLMCREDRAETERAALADRNRDLDTQLTRERQQRLAAEAAERRIRAFLEDMRTWCSPYGVAADYANRALEVLDADQPKETP